jgi:hypothetical protein
MTMRNSVATLCEYLFYGDYTVGLLKDIAAGQLLVASGFAEGRTGTSILDPLMKATPQAGGGYCVSGSKKPCSLSNSMHILTASVAVPGNNGNGNRRAVVVVPADAEGISRKPFWSSNVLRGAESDELCLTDVRITDEQLFFPEVEESLDAVEAGGFLWFELLVAASYLGVASALVEKAIVSKRGDANERLQLATEVEGAMSALEGIARAMAGGDRGEGILVQSLLVRFLVQQAIERATPAPPSPRRHGLHQVSMFRISSRPARLWRSIRRRVSASPAIDEYLMGNQRVA